MEKAEIKPEELRLYKVTVLMRPWRFTDKYAKPPTHNQIIEHLIETFRSGKLDDCLHILIAEAKEE